MAIHNSNRTSHQGGAGHGSDTWIQGEVDIHRCKSFYATLKAMPLEKSKALIVKDCRSRAQFIPNNMRKLMAAVGCIEERRRKKWQPCIPPRNSSSYPEGYEHANLDAAIGKYLNNMGDALRNRGKEGQCAWDCGCDKIVALEDVLKVWCEDQRRSERKDPLRAVVRCWKCKSLVGIHSKLKSSDARFKKAFIEQVIYWDVYYSERVFHCNDTLTLLKSDLYIPRCSCIYNTPPEDIKTKVLQKSKENMGMQGERFDCIACKNRVSISHAYGEKQCGVQLPICNGCVDKQKDKIFRGLDELESVPNLYEQRESLDIFLLD